MSFLEVKYEMKTPDTKGNQHFRTVISDLMTGSAQADIVFNREMFKAMVENAPIAIYILEDESLAYTNPHFTKLVGYEKHALVSGKVTFFDIIHPEDLPFTKDLLTKRLAGEAVLNRYRIRMLHKDGHQLHVEIHAALVEVQGKVAVMGSVIDVTEEITAQLLLQENQERFQSLFYHNPDAIFMLDKSGQFIDINPASKQLSGYSINELLEMHFMPLFSETDLLKAIDSFEQALNGIPNSYEIPLIRKDGVTRFVHISAFPMKISGEITGVYGIVKDITERLEYHKQIEQLAFYDSLTGLPNRPFFEERLKEALEISRENNQITAILFLDLDRFKLINDSLGHHFGDEFLKIISKRLLDNLRKSDTVARFAGDEFTILIPDTDEAQVVKLAERINKALTEAYNIDGHSFSISASIGIALSNAGDETAEELLRRADAAMYHAKRLGKNTYKLYSKELEADIEFKLTIERDLKTAIVNKEFTLYYQPIVQLSTGVITGMEALIRWNHPRLGLLPPDRFIPISEECGLSVSIGNWVLLTACTQNKLWQTQGHTPFKISVNISTIQLQHHEFVPIVEAILTRTGLEPQWLELEVTESTLMEETDQLKKNLANLRKLGVSIAIDDFGTGYTSLNYLRQYTFDSIKIDRSFIQDINDELNGKAIISSIITLSHKLNMRVIAEGIENETQAAYLKAEGSDQGQGYYFSRPLPAQQLKL
jgi:diguanylate cyclase (GGDEF)-like protein/PAS domain S-box-containing protein